MLAAARPCRGDDRDIARDLWWTRDRKLFHITVWSCDREHERFGCLRPWLIESSVGELRVIV